VKVVDFASAVVDLYLRDLSGGSRSEPANDVRPPESRRKKKWSTTLRSADLAELMKRERGR
jgi:hypothetical protein